MPRKPRTNVTVAFRGVELEMFNLLRQKMSERGEKNPTGQLVSGAEVLSRAMVAHFDMMFPECKEQVQRAMREVLERSVAGDNTTLSEDDLAMIGHQVLAAGSAARQAFIYMEQHPDASADQSFCT